MLWKSLSSFHRLLSKINEVLKPRNEKFTSERLVYGTGSMIGAKLFLIRVASTHQAVFMAEMSRFTKLIGTLSISTSDI